MPESPAIITQPDPWMKWVLRAAGIYNLAWGAYTVLWPNAYFDQAGLARLNHPEIWQCVGMIVGVYGIGYWIAARAPFTHWPIILVGLLGKLLGPVGFLNAVWKGTLPWKAGLTNVTNDLIWWAPFTIILWRAYRHHQEASYGRRDLTLTEALQSYHTTSGRSLAELSNEQPLLLVFLRHFGCIFCAEAVADLMEQRLQIEAAGSKIVLVHTADEAAAAANLKRWGAEGWEQVSDPSTSLYHAFGLNSATWAAVMGPRTWWRGLLAFVQGHRPGSLQGHLLQMPGAFVLHHGKVVRSVRHRYAGERPDYVKLALGES